MTPEIKRKEGEDSLAYKYRICRDKDILGLDSWQQVADTLNQEFGTNWSESTYRKWFNNFQSGVEYGKKQISNDEYVREIEDKTIELEKARIKLQTEKIEYNKWKREDARSEDFYEKLLKSIENKRTIQVPKYRIELGNSKRAAVGEIADMHYGKKVKILGLDDEIINEYNVEIFEKRMWELLNRLITALEKEQQKHIYLFNLSDSIDGILRMSQLQSLQLGITDSIIGFSDFLVNWLNELSKYVFVEYFSCRGNHMELRPLGSKKGEFPHENTERLINWYLEGMLKENPNIKIHKNKDVQYVDVLGTKIFATHGQDETNLEKSIKDYMLTYGKPIHVLLTGHLHNSHEKTIGMSGIQNIEFIQAPSICGIDEFSWKLRKTANAGSLLMIFEEGYGKVNTYDFRLK